MAERGWAAIVLVWVILGASGEASAGQNVALRLNLIDKMHVPPRELAKAKAEAETIFGAAGVTIEWTTSSAPLTLMIVANHEPATTTGGCVLGRAVPALASGFVFYNKIADTSSSRPIDVAVVLGRVMAHELGHLLLPNVRHASYGIMRADLDLGYRNPDRFTAEQARHIRRALTSEP